MAKEKEKVILANAGTPAADIPDLKKKDRERKRAGAAWSGVRGAGGEFTGATGGTVARAAASAAGMATEAAMVDGGVGGFAAALARLTSTLLGKVMVGLAALAVVAGLFGFVSRLRRPGDVGSAAPDLGAISDSMRVRAGGDDRMGVASKGEVRFDAGTAKKPAAVPPPPPAAKAVEEKAPEVKPDAAPPAFTPTNVLAHNMSGAKLSSSIGGSFGSKNIFAGGKTLPQPQFGTSLVQGSQGVKGNLSAMKASTIHATPSRLSINKGSTNKAFGQLRLAKGLSLQGATSTSNEGASASAQDAFDQQQSQGGNLATIGAPGGDSVASPSQGAPDTTMPAAPNDPTAPNDGQYQSEQEQINALANEAAANLKLGLMLVAIGTLLIGIGMSLLGNPFTEGIGIALIGIGTMLVALGVFHIAEAMQEEAQAKAMANSLQQQFGDNQVNTINQCTTQTVNTQTTVDNCQPTTDDTNATASDPAQLQQACVGNGLTSVNGTCVQSGGTGTAVITK